MSDPFDRRRGAYSTAVTWDPNDARKLRRERAGLTQAELARKAFIAERTVRNWELGRYVTANTQRRIERAIAAAEISRNRQAIAAAEISRNRQDQAGQAGVAGLARSRETGKAGSQG